MRRRLARLLFVVLMGTLATVLGVLTSLTLTPPGRALLARTVTTLLDRIVLGQVRVGAISGSFLYDLTLEDLVVRDTAGALLADLPRVRASYRLPNLLAGRVVLSGLQLDRPTIQFIKHRNGRMNYEEVLGIGKGAPGGRSPLVQFHDVRVQDGTFRLALPWNPPREAQTEEARDSALRAERAKPGRIIEDSPEGLRRIVLLADLTTRMSRLRIATPDRRPFTIDLDSLATRVSDPQVTLTDAVGRVRIRGDSVVFSLARGALPDTRFSGGGAVTWPRDTVLLDFQVVAPRVNLADLRWISPDFPAMVGRGTLAARSETGARTAYDVRDLRLRGPLGRVDGDLVAITDRRRGLGVRDMALRLQELDLDVVRPYLDTLPFYGTLSGTVRGSGFLDDLELGVDWRFVDAAVPGRPVTTIAGEGRVGSPRGRGLTFADFAVRRSDVALRTVRRLAPAVILEGRLAASGTLTGPLRDVTFLGTAEHRDEDRPASRVEGMIHLDTRADTLGLATDVVLAPLSFAGIRRAFPELAARGELRGRVVSAGTLADLGLDASLTGELGSVEAEGRVTLLPPRWGAEELRLRFAGLDLAALTGRDLPTSLNGELLVTGGIDTLRAPEAALALALARSRIRDVTLDSLFAVGGVRDSVIRLDTAYATMRGARARGSGTLGWAAPHGGRLAFQVQADSLVGFDSLLLAVSGQPRDTGPEARPLGGRARMGLTLAGNLDSLQAGGDLAVEDFAWQRVRTPRATAAFVWTGGTRPGVIAALSADSAQVGDWPLRQVGLQARGRADSLEWSGGTMLGADSRIDGAGGWWRRGDTRVLTVEHLRAALAAHTYRLEEMVALTLSDPAPALSPLTLRAEDGSGVLQLAGRVPGSARGSLLVRVLGLDLRDVYGLLQRDTAGVRGELGVELEVGGTAADPTLRGTARLGEATIGDFRAPFLQGIVDYADRRLEANLLLWRTGERVLAVEARLPMDLAFRGVERRRLPGPLAVRARADSVDLGILEALTPAVRRVSGRVAADVEIGGTWEVPRLAGSLRVVDGAMTIPGLGIRLGTLEGRVDLQGDSLLVREVLLTSGGGRLRVGGSVRLEDLNRPRLALRLEADQFRAVDLRNFLAFTGSGELQLRGPVFGATLTGNLTANSGVLYFADLVTKAIVNLEDPTIADLVDTTLIRRENLGARLQNRFLDSLRVENLRVQMGSDFWLRSAEANVQLDGNLQVSKAGGEWNPTGTLSALRGGYTLKIGPVARDFTVEQGSVTYFNDLNAALNIQARHTVHPVRGGEDIPVIAKITGTLYAPRVELESTLRPPIPQGDLISYLIFGYPAAEATQLGQGRAVEAGLTYFSSALSSEFERFLIQDIGFPLDIVEIRPALSASGTGGTTLSQLTLAAGWQIGRKTFLTFNAGFCPENLGQVSYRNLGVSLEFRFSREWRLQSSVEPTLQSCTPRGSLTSITTNERQVGLDVLWDREF